MPQAKADAAPLALNIDDRIEDLNQALRITQASPPTAPGQRRRTFLAPKARPHLEAWGNAPGNDEIKKATSAESPIHFTGEAMRRLTQSSERDAGD
jgi:hypothetical protein